jgi:hypothetical protein
MRLKLARNAAVALATAAALGAAGSASAAATLTIGVSCKPAALSAALATATGNETLLLAPACRYVLTSALPAVRANLTIDGDRASIDRSTAVGTPLFAILTVASGNLAVSRLSFSNGYGGAISYQSGSAAGGSVTVTGGAFTGNAGGAIDVDGSPGGPLTVTGATFTRNSGGAINDGDAFAGAGVLTVSGSTFTGNTGGAITDFGSVNAPNDTVIDSAFTGNVGGGINYQSYIIGSHESTLTVIGSAFTHNAGGGINCATVEGCSLAVSGAAFTGNAGGGISTGPTIGVVEMTVSGSRFTGNTAVQGGAIDLDSFSAGSLIAISDYFTDNSAAVGGGAIYNFDYVAASSSTFRGNSAPVGAGLENEWQAAVTGSTFSGNTAQSNGGGLYNDDEMSVTGGSFSGNTAGSGGAIYQVPDSLNNLGQNTPTLSLTGAVISANEAAADGGGIGNATVSGYSGPGPDPGTVAVTLSRIAGNSAGTDGGGIYNFGGGSVSLTSSAVLGNAPDDCAPANAVPGCQNSAGSMAPAGEQGSGQSASPPGVHCVVERPGSRDQVLDPRPGQCGVHDRAAGWAGASAGS